MLKQHSCGSALGEAFREGAAALSEAARQRAEHDHRSKGD
jgi:hypothetical protein